MNKGGTELFASLMKAWQGRWREALDIWSLYARLKNPVFCITPADEKREGLTGSFAMIRLSDLSVVISLRQVDKIGLAGFPREVLCHEIGHHIYCPSNYTDLARMTARMRRALPTRENSVGLIGNLYCDLMINDRLFREHGLEMDAVYQRINQETDDPLWNFYMRIYEILWSLPGGSLTSIKMTDEMEGDALLGNRLIRHYARDWMSGAGRFAALCLTYLLAQKTALPQSAAVWLDTLSPGGTDSVPSGLTEIEPDEITGTIHPALEGKMGEGKKTSDGGPGMEGGISVSPMNTARY